MPTTEKWYKVTGSIVKLTYFGIGHSAAQVGNFVHKRYHADAQRCPGKLEVEELNEDQFQYYKSLGIRFENCYFQ